MEVKIYINDELVQEKDICNYTITNESVIEYLGKIKERILIDMQKNA